MFADICIINKGGCHIESQLVMWYSLIHFFGLFQVTFQELEVQAPVNLRVCRPM